MILQFLPSQRINKLLSLQANVASCYEKMANITTESDLQRIFLALQKHHTLVKEELESSLYSDANQIKVSLKKGKSLFDKVWREVLIAVLVNNRKKITEYCRQNEIKLLQEIHSIIHAQNNTSEIIEILSDYEKKVNNYLEKLSALPIDKVYIKAA